MSARRITAFFYGLFMDEQLLRAKGVDPKNARRASAPGFALRIGNRATLVGDDASTAYGVVMDLTHDEIDRLYSEPSVSMYRPEAVIVQVEGEGSAPALCFNLTETPRPDESNAEYATKLRDLARRLELPSDYVESIH